MQLTEILDQFRVAYKTEGQHCRPGWIQLDCPHCDGELYLGYNLSGGYLNCWRCGPQQVLYTLGKLTGESFNVLRSLLDDLELVKRIRERKEQGRVVVPRGIAPLAKPHRRYLKGRGYNLDELVRLWKIQGIGIAANLAWRVWIPIIYQGEIVSWTTRSILDVKARYISASAADERLDHKDLLYGEDYCRHAAVVHEGPFDVWRTGPGSVATMGTGYSRAQVLKLSKYPIRAIAFDNEKEAQQRARMLCDLLEPFPGQTFNVVLDAKDASEASAQEIKELRTRFLD